MITKELLHDNRDYVLTHREELKYGSTPNPMFVDGKFSQDNWNSGDGIIRQFLSYIECGDNWRQMYQHEDLVMIVNYKLFEDTHYVNIVFSGSFHIDSPLDKEVPLDKYSFSWYKHRGRTDTATHNRKPLLEDDYIKLLNNIENLTKFKFKLKGEI